MILLVRNDLCFVLIVSALEAAAPAPASVSTPSGRGRGRGASAGGRRRAVPGPNPPSNERLVVFQRLKDVVPRIWFATLCSIIFNLQRDDFYKLHAHLSTLPGHARRITPQDFAETAARNRKDCHDTFQATVEVSATRMFSSHCAIDPLSSHSLESHGQDQRRVSSPSTGTYASKALS